jgi:mannosylfructose-6-phosphate phosphatase
VGPQRLLVSDLDGTLLGDDDALGRFRDWWSNAADDGWSLVYATGRTLTSVDGLVSDGMLPRPLAVISNVGTEIHGTESGRWSAWPGWPTWDPGWIVEPARRMLIDRVGMRPQIEANQTRWKASFDAPGMRSDAVEQVRADLAAAGIEATVVYSSDRDLDVMPPGSGKAAAARLVARDLGLDDGSVIAAGDTGNDLDLLTAGFRGIVVANARAELLELRHPSVYHARSAHAAGVLEGIRHWTTGAHAVPDPRTVDGSVVGTRA